MPKSNRSSARSASRHPPLPPVEVVEVESRGQTLRAATYARVSSPKQKTVVEQTRICRERAEERGWKVAYVLQDQGLQGDDLERPAFQRLMDLAERHAIDVVVCWKIDRLARSLAHAVTLEETLSRHGVAIHSCTEPIDTTSPVGRFLFGNLANAAQLEKAIIRERVRMGVHSQALQGRWLQPQVPLGYRRTKGLYLRVVPEEATTVRAVFEVYQVHQSYAEAAAALCAAGLTNRGKPWTGERVRQTLENEIYRGKYVASGVVKMVPHLAIVTPETFEAVRSLRLAAPRRGRLSSPSLRERAIDQVFAQYLDGLRDLG